MTAILDRDAPAARPISDRFPGQTTIAAEQSWELVQRAQAGDTAAFAALYDRYVDTVYRFISWRVHGKHAVEDLTADVFVKALRNIGRFTWQGRDFGAWLVTIARNRVADHYKVGHGHWETPVETPFGRGDQRDLDPEPESRPEQTVVDHLANLALVGAVKQLNPEQQECIVLRFLQGMSIAETAQVMGKNAAAIKALQYRAVRTLARLLPEGFER